LDLKNRSGPSTAGLPCLGLTTRGGRARLLRLGDAQSTAHQDEQRDCVLDHGSLLLPGPLGSAAGAPRPGPEVRTRPRPTFDATMREAGKPQSGVRVRPVRAAYLGQATGFAIGVVDAVWCRNPIG
jgi:hypothetical protein